MKPTFLQFGTDCSKLKRVITQTMALRNDWDDIEGPIEWNDAGYESGYYSNDDEVNNHN